LEGELSLRSLSAFSNLGSAAFWVSGTFLSAISQFWIAFSLSPGRGVSAGQSDAGIKLFFEMLFKIERAPQLPRMSGVT